MIQMILMMAIWGLGIFGLYIFIFGIDKVLDRLKAQNNGIIAAVAAGIILVSALFEKIGLPIILVGVLGVVIIFVARITRGKNNPATLKYFIKGLFCLAVMMSVDLITGHFYSKTLEATGIFVGVSSVQVREVCLLQVALFAFLLILTEAFIQMKDYNRRILICVLMIKTIEEVLFIYIMTNSGFLMRNHQATSALLLMFQVFDYIAFISLMMNVKVVKKQQKRADININKYEYYLHMEEEHLKIRRLYHDMKNQLMMLDNPELAENSKLKAFREATSKEMESMENFYHTGRNTLDIILFDSRRRAESKGIEFDAVISEHCLDFLEEIDLCAIFINAINNAIEACDKITSGPKKIQIKAGENLNDVMVYINNTMDVSKQKGSLKTSKKDKKNHGIGMSSIQKAVDKYQGYVSIKETDNFQLTILFVKGSDDDEN